MIASSTSGTSDLSYISGLSNISAISGLNARSGNTSQINSGNGPSEEASLDELVGSE